MDKLAEITQHLLRFSPDALIVVDERREICYANETAFGLFGYAAADLIGQTLEVLLPERLRSRHKEYVAGFMRNPSNREMGVRISDLTARRADGSEFPAGIRLAPFKVGDRLYSAAAIRDITESRRINEELIAAREEADRANRAKSRFLATASHDLRQPLQTIRLLNASMLKMVERGELSELLEGQGEAIGGMARLLNGLLDISRLESGAVEPQHSEVFLPDLLAELRSELEPVARARSLGLQVEMIDVVLFTDRTLLRQLLENLLGNAIKYTDHGHVALRCSLNADALLIDITDTGIGIPSEKIERIFDEYYQVDVHGTRRAGVGLGLAIVREVARVLGHSIKVTSQVGVGTHVQIRVPKQTLVEHPLFVVQTTTSVLPHSITQNKPRLILVEDNDGVRRATELFLTLEGFEITSGASAAEAERLLTDIQDNQILIVDFHLDGANTGLDVVRKARGASGKEIPAIIMSGDLPSVLRNIKEPMNHCRFLSKPVDTKELLNAIHELS